MKNFSRTDKYPCESGCCKDPDAIDCEWKKLGYEGKDQKMIGCIGH